jgi:hypothetical protein
LHTMYADSKRVAFISHTIHLFEERISSIYINEISSTISCHLVKIYVFSERIHPVPLQYFISNRIRVSFCFCSHSKWIH